MTINHAFIDLAERLAHRLGGPRVRTLHLPALHERPAAKDAEFCALELEEGAVGLSYLWLGDTAASLAAGDFVRALPGQTALAVAQGYASADPAARALAFAAINALSQLLFLRAGWTPPAAGSSIGGLVPAPGDHIGMVGLFPPLLSKITGSGARLTVLELRPDLAGERDGYRVTLDPAELATCSKVICTSTVLLNNTLDHVLRACRNAEHFAIIGPTAGCLPDALFAKGVDCVGGTQVTDLEGFRHALAAGEPWGRHARKYEIRRGEYPGADVLLGRVS